MKYVTIALLMGVSQAQTTTSATANTSSSELPQSDLNWEPYTSEKIVFKISDPADNTTSSKLAGTLTYWHKGERTHNGVSFLTRNATLYRSFVVTGWNIENGAVPADKFLAQGWNERWIQFEEGIMGKSQNGNLTTDICWEKQKINLADTSKGIWIDGNDKWQTPNDWNLTLGDYSNIDVGTNDCT
jgi:hypothetical protein